MNPDAVWLMVYALLTSVIVGGTVWFVTDSAIATYAVVFVPLLFLCYGASRLFKHRLFR